ncbi:hypothetical protein SELMODRAFT_405974 [Selaginella moellendorffii]|uniref:Uncharacterized protein n=1 Tax=Selaginella moellendorffii TaxID=88036 RepID=D8R095_SELML|nr:hypothetical protein SELMODRAFT_405974 [Selaginella moellendorffii]
MPTIPLQTLLQLKAIEVALKFILQLVRTKQNSQGVVVTKHFIRPDCGRQMLFNVHSNPVPANKELPINLQYVCYLDEFVVGVRVSRAFAERIQALVLKFMKMELHLEPDYASSKKAGEMLEEQVPERQAERTSQAGVVRQDEEIDAACLDGGTPKNKSGVPGLEQCKSMVRLKSENMVRDLAIAKLRSGMTRLAVEELLNTENIVFYNMSAIGILEEITKAHQHLTDLLEKHYREIQSQSCRRTSPRDWRWYGALPIRLIAPLDTITAKLRYIGMIKLMLFARFSMLRTSPSSLTSYTLLAYYRCSDNYIKVKRGWQSPPWLPSTKKTIKGGPASLASLGLLKNCERRMQCLAAHGGIQPWSSSSHSCNEQLVSGLGVGNPVVAEIDEFRPGCLAGILGLLSPRDVGGWPSSTRRVAIGRCVEANAEGSGARWRQGRECDGCLREALCGGVRGGGQGQGQTQSIEKRANSIGADGVGLDHSDVAQLGHDGVKECNEPNWKSSISRALPLPALSSTPQLGNGEVPNHAIALFQLWELLTYFSESQHPHMHRQSLHPVCLRSSLSLTSQSVSPAFLLLSWILSSRDPHPKEKRQLEAYLFRLK